MADISSLLQQLRGNAGDNLTPAPQAGALVQPPLPSPGFDPNTYGQSGGEATFFGSGPNGPAPVSAIGSIGIGKDAPLDPGTGGKPDITSLLAMLQKILGNKQGGGGLGNGFQRPQQQPQQQPQRDYDHPFMSRPNY